MRDNSARETLELTVAPATTTTLYVTKTVEPSDPDTGGIVSICFSIGGSEPRQVDVVLAQDVSWSMNELAGEGATQTRLEACQAAARTFVNRLPDTDRVAVVPYSDTVYMDHVLPLTTAKSRILDVIDGLRADGATNIGDGIKIGHEELITSPRYTSGTIKTIILLSDGRANRPISETVATAYALERAEATTRDNIRIYTIGFGSDADEGLLRSIADMSGGHYFSAPHGSVLETVYLTIALELHNLTITDILAPGVEVDCLRWPDDLCIRGPSGVTSITFPISDSLLISGSAAACFTATVNLDPGYRGPINMPGSRVCYQSSNGETVCDEFENPIVKVGGRKIQGFVFNDANTDGHQDVEEVGVPDVIVRTGTDVTTTTDISGGYVLRTSSEPTISVGIEMPLGYFTTTPSADVIPSTTGIYTVSFGIHRPFHSVHLPIVTRSYPPPPIIINGGFEDGWTGWRHGGELLQSITSTKPASGIFSAMLGDPAYKCEGGVPKGSAWVEQTVLIPASVVSPTLFFSYDIITQDKNPYLSDDFDSFDVKVNGDRVFRDAKRTGEYGCTPEGKKDLGWRDWKVDITPYSGQYVTVRFENISRPDYGGDYGWYNTWTLVDNVRIEPASTLGQLADLCQGLHRP